MKKLVFLLISLISLSAVVRANSDANSIEPISIPFFKAKGDTVVKGIYYRLYEVDKTGMLEFVNWQLERSAAFKMDFPIGKNKTESFVVSLHSKDDEKLQLIGSSMDGSQLKITLSETFFHASILNLKTNKTQVITKIKLFDVYSAFLQ